MANDHSCAGGRDPGRALFLDTCRYVVVTDPVRFRRGCRSLYEVIAYSDSDGLCFHAETGASNRLRILVRMFDCPRPLALVFFRTFAAPVSPSNGWCAAQGQRRTKRMLRAVRLCSGFGRSAHLGCRQAAIGGCHHNLGVSISCGHLSNFYFENRRDNDGGAYRAFRLSC